MLRSLLIARRHSAKLLETQDAALYHIALGIIRFDKHHRPTTRGPALLTLLPLVTTLRDQMPDAPTPQGSPTTRVAVALVVNYLARTLSRSTPTATRHTDGIQSRLHPVTIACLAF
jgi:hypothetical protein